jgi:integrase
MSSSNATADKLTDLQIKQMKPPTDRARDELRDPEVPGLTLRVTRDGQKTFALRYRNKHGQQRRLTLGQYPALSLSEARRQATIKRGEVAKGGDPAEDKQRAKVGTLSELVREFIAEWCKPRNRTADQTERLLKNELVAAFGKNRDYATITRREINDLIKKIHRRAPAQARNTLAAIKTCFNWAVSRDYIENSPAHGVKALAPPSKRGRFLSDAELAAVWTATCDEDWPFGPLLRLLLLTGQRRAQIADMRWSWVNFDSETITFPSSRMKNKCEFVLPMSAVIVTLLRDLPHFAVAGGKPDELDDRVFPSRTESNKETGPSGFSKAKKRIDQSSGVSGWTFHDFRRTMSTYLNGPGRLEPHIVERLLSHKIAGIASIYNKWDYLEEKRAALELWGAHPSFNSALTGTAR